MSDWCYVCGAKQWVWPNGAHRCASNEELQTKLDRIYKSLQEIMLISKYDKAMALDKVENILKNEYYADNC